ncbi:flagellar hook-basal body complex protein FliE [Leifsonia sp. Leaf264]|uniref:flagellar hook-basal body complex protein FliE n=1 Tax=Leifsonia sp. Leaf264 TaxID=1736314 RepID=UPI0006F5615F|nr:flagellar hook-basal body complex protein FliE [Leifsonia sp. Leaf264]KQO98231.1 hypothetical protein ASF30_09220 [Leifsonia sp. Leaf264]
MPITPIAAVEGVTGTGYITEAPAVAAPSGGDNFAASLAGAIDYSQSLQGDAKTKAVQAVTGDLDDIHDATIAATRAQVQLELVSAVRGKFVEGFNEIMRLQA